MAQVGIHGGDRSAAAARAGCQPSDILDFSANINPFGPPPGVLDAALRSLREESAHYPHPTAQPLKARLQERLGVPVVLGNGATELLYVAVQGALAVHVRQPSYLGYAEAAAAAGARLTDRPDEADVIIVGRPNNPDGDLPSAEAIAAIARVHPQRRVLVDESFLALTDAPSCVQPDMPGNLLVLTSMTKTFSIPGLRLGWLAGLDLRDLERRIPPWTVNAPALAAGLVCLQHEPWLAQCRDQIAAWRRALQQDLLALSGVVSVRGAANFLLVELSWPIAGALEQALLLNARILIRNASGFAGLDARFIRVAVRSPAENARLCSALQRHLQPSL